MKQMGHGIEINSTTTEETLKNGDLEKEVEAPQDVDDLINLLGLGRWTFLMVAPYLCWALVLPYFSIGSALLNPNVDHWCEETFTNVSGQSVSSALWIKTDGEWRQSPCYHYDLEKWRTTTRDFTQPELVVAEVFVGPEYLPEFGENLPEFGEDLPESEVGDGRLWNMTSEHVHSEVGPTWNMTGVPVKQCNSWVYDTSTFESTVTSEWDLVCAAAGLSPFFQSVYYFGTAVGEPLLGYLSDKLGRRWVLRRIVILFAMASVISVVTTSYPLLLTMRFLLGVVHTANSVAYVMVVESCPSRQRSQIGLALMATYGVTGMVFGGLAYFVREWRTLQAICILPGLLHLLYMPFLFESPRWLLQQGKLDQAKNTFQFAAKLHAVELPKDLQLQQLVKEKHDKVSSSVSCSLAESIHYWFRDLSTLVRTPVIRRISLALSGCWFVVGLSFWGMSLAGDTFSSDPFLYLTLSSLMEVFGYTWIIPLLFCFGRRTVLSGNFAGCATAMLLMLVIPKDNTWVVFSLAMVGKVFVTGAVNLLYLYSVELFPTCVRNRGLNLASMMGRLASISAPFVVQMLAKNYSWAPSVVFGSATAAGTFLALLLPESRGRPMLDSVEQLEENYGRKGKMEEGTPATKNQRRANHSN